VKWGVFGDLLDKEPHPFPGCHWISQQMITAKLDTLLFFSANSFFLDYFTAKKL